jgi:uncharacterized protein YegP (UPF0339 family)
LFLNHGDYHKTILKKELYQLRITFINGVDPLVTIDNHLKEVKYSFAENYGIYDFCLGAGTQTSLSNDIERSRSYRKNLYLNRYGISNGVDLIKRLEPLAKNYLTSTKHQMKVDDKSLSIFNVITR